MISSASGAVRDALVLAAGNGDRFVAASGTSKLLQPVLGEPLILRTIRTATRAGLTRFELVVGYEADAVSATVLRHLPSGVSVRFIFNEEWHLENGVSALAAGDYLNGRHFALLMGDHLFEAGVLARMLRAPLGGEESILAVDSRSVTPQVALEATKVRLDGTRITAIGKDLEKYDALDTGLFVCAPALFPALREARAAGDTTLSGGIRRLAARGLVRASDIGNAAWYDIDTRSDLAAAEVLLGASGPA